MEVGITPQARLAQVRLQTNSRNDGGNSREASGARGKAQHETQLQNMHGNAAARRRHFRGRARGKQPGLGRNCDWSAAAAACGRGAAGMPWPRSRIFMGGRLLVSGERSLLLASRLLDAPSL